MVNELLVKAEIALLNLQKLATSLSDATSRPSQVPLRENRAKTRGSEVLPRLLRRIRALACGVGKLNMREELSI